eukprot:g18398.t1
MSEITLEVQGRCGHLLKLQVATDSTPMLRLTLPALNPSELSSPAASFLRLNRDPANKVLHFLSPDDWLELQQTSRGGRVAVGGSGCWQQELGGKAAYLARRRALYRVSRAFEDLRRFARSPASVFNPGATFADTLEAEARTGVVFPDEARASFLLFNGQARSAWLRSEGVIGGFELLSLEDSVELMLEEACFRGASPGQPPEFVPLANRRNSNAWLAVEVAGGRVCVMKPLSRPKVVASSWSQYLRVQ